jgi:polyisoprenyl-teichoic acid--peptidoglycan teichoic acid transferase
VKIYIERDKISMNEDQMEPRSRYKPKKKRRGLRITLLLLLFIIVGIGGYGGYLYYKVSSVSDQSLMEPNRGDQSDLRNSAVDIGKDHFSVLLLGVDDEENTSNGRSDSMMVATFNQDDKSMKLLSIPRDSYVEIPGRGMDKITHAHAYGGIDLTIDTVEGLLGIPIDEVVRVNFDAFKTVIDELGGIDVTIDSQLVADQLYKESKGKIDLEVGEQTLNGKEALAFARTRKADSDLKRGQRQMEVITAAMDKVSSLSSIPKYGDVVDRIGENLTMSFTFNEAIGLYPFISKIDTVEKLQLTGTDFQPAGTYYFKLDDQSLATAKTELKSHLNLEDQNNDPNGNMNALDGEQGETP